MTNSPRWDNQDQQARQQYGQSGQQGGWNDDDHRPDTRSRSQWSADRSGQPQQREWSSGSANRSDQPWGAQQGGAHDGPAPRQDGYGRSGAGTAPGYAPSEPSHDWGSDERRHDDWRSPGSQGFAAGYGMSDGDNYDDRYRRNAGAVGGASKPGFGRGYGPDYGRDGGSGTPGERGFFAKAGDEIASWFGDENAAHRREQDYRGHGPSDYTRSDERIREDVNDRLTDDPRLNARQISVAVANGEVTLNGSVDSREAKRRAEDTIDRISGVKHVQNNLRVTQGGGSGSTAGAVSATGSSSAGAAPGVTPTGTATARKEP